MAIEHLLDATIGGLQIGRALRPQLSNHAMLGASLENVGNRKSGPTWIGQLSPVMPLYVRLKRKWTKV
jgi:hypothetical protein